MSCGILSLLTNMTLAPTWIVNSFGLTPLAVMVTTGGTAAGGGGADGEGAVGVGDGDPESPLPHAAARSAITAAETTFDRSNRRDMG